MMSFLLPKASEIVNLPPKQFSKEPNNKEGSNKSSEILKNGDSLPMPEQQHAWKEFANPEEKSGQMCELDILNPCYLSEKDIWDEAPVNELISKLITRIRLIPEAVIEADSKKSDDVECTDSVITNFGVANGLDGVLNSEVPLWSDECSCTMVFQGLPQAAYHRDVVELKSALRGGYEKSGMGLRPKLHVTWAPDVYDPLCTSSSHTMSQDSRKQRHPKNERKNHKSKDSGHKGKGNGHGESYKKHHKKLSRKLRQESLLVSGQTITAQNIRLNGNYMLRSGTDADLGESSANSTRINPFILSQKARLVRHLLALDTSIPYSWQLATRKLYL